MLTRRVGGFLFFSFLLFHSALLFAQGHIRVPEGRTQLVINQSGAVLTLAVESEIAQSVPARIQIQTVDTDDRIVGSQSREVTLMRGANRFDIPLKAADLPGSIWVRLKYHVTSSGSGDHLEEAHGLISISEISAHPFVLRLGLPSNVTGASRCRVHVFTQHPGSGRPVGNVDLVGSLTVSVDGDERILKASARTNASGYAALDFDVPAHVEDSRAPIEVSAQSGPFTRQAQEEIFLLSRSQMSVTTDKPIYQPGQHLRVRVLAFDRDHRARENAPIRLSIQDPEGLSMYHAALLTSRFGETDTEWLIPDNVRLGDYQIEVESEDLGQPLVHPVKISRYELPAFTVVPAADRLYYVPNQNAKVTIKAEYLFGQPVKQGHVRVLRQTNRQWNYRERKWETEESSPVEGELDSAGMFVATLDLKNEHARLGDRDYVRFEDLKYAAYVTDASTNRTEERRFDVRVSKEGIHVYVSRDIQPEGFPLEFYLSASNADGTPSRSRISVYEMGHPEPLSTVNTNRYGVAKIIGLRSNTPDLTFVADDGKGGHGTFSESVTREDSGIRVYTNKTIYRRGDALEVQIRSTHANGSIIFEISQDSRLIQSKILPLRNGKAFLVIPYDSQFKDDVRVAVRYVGTPQDSDDAAGRTVVYPRNRDLRIDTRMDKARYAPGDEASIAMRVRSPDGAPQPSLVGVVVLDKAVEERARTDDEFGRQHWFCDICAGSFGSAQGLSGLSRRDLDRLDLSQPVPPDLELAAEILLNAGGNRWADTRLTDDDEGHPRWVFRNLISKTLSSLKTALNEQFIKDGTHPTDIASLQRLLSSSGLDLNSFLDPWGRAYRYSFSVQRISDVLVVQSAGPDKRFGSADDIQALYLTWPYFQPQGTAIDSAVQTYHGRTGHFIRDLSTLRTELLQSGQNMDSWSDRWGRPYRFEFGVSGKVHTITITSSGPDGVFDSPGQFPSDDFTIWTSSTSWAQEVQGTLLDVVNSYLQRTSTFPDTPERFAEALAADEAAKARLTDAWMHDCYPMFKTEYAYMNRISLLTYRQYLGGNSEQTSSSPVTGKIQFLVLRSPGPDGINGTPDDFDVAVVSRVQAEQAAEQAKPQDNGTAPVLIEGRGAVQGAVTDANKALLPGVRVVAKSSVAGEFQAITNETGQYLLANLPSGRYELSFELPGFTQKTIQEVPVQSGGTTSVSVTLEVASIAQNVEVSVAAESLALTTVSASLSAQKEIDATRMSAPMSTPRLRDYFPETLLWLPALETDRFGRAQAKFKVADSITTWKMAAVVSTTDGQIGLVEKEFVSSVPFFIEHDPPRILTQGDQIALPLNLRSYLDKDQSVELTMDSSDWFELLDARTRHTRIHSGETVRETFSFKAVKSTPNGRQRITANGSIAGDSIEKTVAVHPDGREMARVTSDLFRDSVSHSTVFPAAMIPNTAREELRIYPNLLAHVVDGIEGILERPYGCAEQTISAAYPSLMLLKYFKERGSPPSALDGKAQRYLRTGIDRLWAYQDREGGFTYWGRGPGDIALTAYAVQFLDDASEIATVDEAALRRAADWLERQQEQDGSWGAPNVTGLVARVLSRPRLRAQNGKRDSMAAALDYLRKQTSSLAEPYMLASLVIAASNVENAELMHEALRVLETTVHRERAGAYWDLQENTPFYGWGLSGRLETTALAIRALAAAKTDAPLVDEGVSFLLRTKDRYGVWNSTQATVNVLDALMTIIGASSPKPAGTSADIFVNGQMVRSVMIPGADESLTPITVDLSRFMAAGENHLEVLGAPGAASSIEFIETYYVPWADSDETGLASDGAGPLKLSVRFDKTEGKAGDEIRCDVTAERVGFRGYGMMLAEIGLPPGAEVDRASLEAVIKEGTGAVDRYDVLPDHVVMYLWPRAGGSSFNFKFRLRYGMNAQTAPSMVYDYYNPDARATVKPVRFVITNE